MSMVVVIVTMTGVSLSVPLLGSIGIAMSSIRCDILLLRPRKGARSIVMSVCVCVCVCVFVCPRSCLPNYTSDLHQIFVHVTYGRGSVFLWRRSDTLRISGFVDDVIFARKLLAARRRRQAEAVRLTRSLKLGA